MSNARKITPRGQGYMPKGGVPAARVHNAEWAATLPAPDSPVTAPAEPEAAVAGQGRARQRVVPWPSTVVLARVGAITGSLSLITVAMHGGR